MGREALRGGWGVRRRRRVGVGRWVCTLRSRCTTSTPCRYSTAMATCGGRARRQGGAPAGGARRSACTRVPCAACAALRALRCVPCAACASGPRERPPRVRGVRCAGGRARLCEDGESIVLLERALGQQVLEELPARQALLRSASRRRVGRGASRAATRVWACAAAWACRAAGRPRRPRLGLDDA